MPDKDSLRQELLSRRDLIPLPVRHAKDRLICMSVAGLEEFIRSANVFSFASFRSEIDTRPIMKEVLSSGKTLILPKVDSLNRRLDLYQVPDLEELVPGFMSIPEPSVLTDSRKREISDADLVIIPGAGFDEKGNRIGYGGGFYDRLLSSLPQGVPVVAPAYEEQLEQSIPSESHDVRVSIIVTDRRTIFCT